MTALVHGIDAIEAYADVLKARPRNTRALGQANNHIDARSRAMAAALQRWLVKLGKREMDRLLGRDVRRLRPIRKDDKGDDIERELLEIMRRYGLQQMRDAGARVTGADWRVRPELIDDFMAEKRIKVVLIAEQTRDEVKAALRVIVRDALNETPRPSARELGRRIARQWFGNASSALPERGSAREAQVTADWRRTQEDIERGASENLFSFARAQTIARTELHQAEVGGIANGLADIGVEQVRWLAYGNDGKSSSRRHYLMNAHKPIDTRAMHGRDRSKWFTLPSGVRCPYPGWIGLPAGEAVNCRCTIAPA